MVLRPYHNVLSMFVLSLRVVIINQKCFKLNFQTTKPPHHVKEVVINIFLYLSHYVNTFLTYFPTHEEEEKKTIHLHNAPIALALYIHQNYTEQNMYLTHDTKRKSNCIVKVFNPKSLYFLWLFQPKNRQSFQAFQDL